MAKQQRIIIALVVLTGCSINNNSQFIDHNPSDVNQVVVKIDQITTPETGLIIDGIYINSHHNIQFPIDSKRAIDERSDSNRITFHNTTTQGGEEMEAISIETYDKQLTTAQIIAQRMQKRGYNQDQIIAKIFATKNNASVVGINTNEFGIVSYLFTSQDRLIVIESQGNLFTPALIQTIELG